MLIYIIGEFYPLNDWVLYPGELSQLFNIITASFIHADIIHLIVNVTVIICVIHLLSRASIAFKPVIDIFIIGIGSNIIVFVLGDPDYAYLGASNVVYGFTAYAFIGFLIGKNYLQLSLMIGLVVLLWPGLAIGQEESISYVSHYSGLLMGFTLYAIRFIKYKYQIK